MCASLLPHPAGLGDILNMASVSLPTQDTPEPHHCAVVSPVSQQHFWSSQMALGSFWGGRILRTGVTLRLSPRGIVVMFTASL